MVTTAGGVEEDFIKCILPSFIEKEKINDLKLRLEGINRIGNMYVPNNNYCKFEDWVMPLLNEMYDLQEKKRD